jgi:hypothetical protein
MGILPFVCLERRRKCELIFYFIIYKCINIYNGYFRHIHWYNYNYTHTHTFSLDLHTLSYTIVWNFIGWNLSQVFRKYFDNFHSYVIIHTFVFLFINYLLQSSCQIYIWFNNKYKCIHTILGFLSVSTDLSSSRSNYRK